MLTGRYFVADFPTDGHVWQLIWVGPIFRNPNVTSDMQVRVFIRRNGWWDPEEMGPRPVLELAVSVGLFPILIVGTRWKDGSMLPDASGQERSCSVVIDPPASADLVKLMEGNEPDLPRYLDTAEATLPNAWKSRFMRVAKVAGHPLGSGAQLLFPCHEIVRFYTACSSDLANMVLSGDPARLAEARSLGTVSGKESKQISVVNLNGKYHESDAVVIARIIASPYAWKAANATLSSVAAKDLEGNAYPVGWFPFLGKTTLRVRGRPVKGSTGKWSFLVDQILSCSGELPFSVLKIRGRARLVNGSGGAQHEVEFHTTVRSPKLKPGIKIPIQSKVPSKPGLQPVSIKADPSQFAAMASVITVREELKKDSSGPGGSIEFAMIPVETLSTGLGDDSAADVGRARLVQSKARLESTTDSRASAAHLAYFERVVRLFETDLGMKVTFRHDSRGRKLKVPPLDSANRTNWHYLDPETKQQVRRLAVVDVQLGDTTVTLMEFERRTREESASIPCFVRSDGAPLSQHQVLGLVTRLRREYGSWPIAKQIAVANNVFGLGRLSHDLTRPEPETASRYLATIQELVRRFVGRA